MPDKPHITLLPQRVRLADALAVALTPLICVALLEGYTRGDLRPVLDWAISRPGMLLLNCLPLLGVSLCFTFMARRRARAAATLVLMLVCSLYGIINHYKLTFRAEPIMLTDVTQLGDAMAVVTGLDFKIDYAQLGRLGLYFAALMALCMWLCKGRASSRPVLPLVLGLALMLSPLLYTFGLAGNSGIDISDHARNEGSLYTAFALENNRRALMRPDYDEAEVRSIYRKLEARAPEASAGVKPNLIMVLAESFTDEAFLGKYLSLTDRLMPFYDGLLTECEHGRLYVPKVGGGTSETEFEVLTGLKSRYSINPYSMGLPPINSLASVLRARGYTSTAIHWYAGVYYNRYHNLKMEGFNAFYTTDTTAGAFERTGMFVSDGEHFRSVLERMKRTDTPDFIFCLTMQNHGGYAYDDFRISYGADVPFSNKLSEGAELAAANYCYLLRQSDRALGELVDSLRALQEPTVLVYFGDHLPPLGAETYAELNIPTTGREAHMTPYFIWSNYETLSGGGDMYSYELGAHALALIGAGDDPYFAEVERLRQAGAAGSDTVDLLAYDALFGRQYAYDEGGLSPECADFQAGGDMQLDGFDAAEVDGAIYLRPRLSQDDLAYTLYINGQACAGFIYPSEDAIRLKCVIQNSSGRVFNQSEELVYASTDELLEKSGRLEYRALPLGSAGYKQIGGASDGAVLLISDEPLYRGFAAAVMDGRRLDMQPAYAVRKAGQAGTDADGHVLLALDKTDIEAALAEAGADKSFDDVIKEYLQAHGTALYCFDK